VVKFNNVEEAEFENLGTTLEVLATGTTTFAGTEFALKQFHMHTPSEHRIAEEYFPLEVHMVHEAADKSIAVIALPFQLTEDGSNFDLLTAVTENIDGCKEPGSITKTGPLDFTELTKSIQEKPLFQYTGSLTTPPCAEGLTFLVLSEPLPINVATFNKIKAVIKFNARYTQNALGQENFLAAATDFANKKDGVSAKCDCTSPGSPKHESTSPAHSTTSSTAAAHETPKGMNHESVSVVEACAMQCKGKRFVPDAFF
jgi:carbonic anhydrase